MQDEPSSTERAIEDHLVKKLLMGEEQALPRLQTSRQRSYLGDFVANMVPPEEAFREDLAADIEPERKNTDSTSVASNEPS